MTTRRPASAARSLLLFFIDDQTAAIIATHDDDVGRWAEEHGVVSHNFDLAFHVCGSGVGCGSSCRPNGHRADAVMARL